MGLFSGSWDMNPYAKELWSKIMGMEGGAVPENILAPITQAGEQERAGIKNRFANIPYGNFAGIENAQLMKSGANTQRAIGATSANYKQQLLQMLLGISTQAQYKPAGLSGLWNSFSQQAGGNLADILI